MSNAVTKGQLTARFRMNVPRKLIGASLNPKVLNDALDLAWENGWHDIDHLLNYAMAGTEHPAIKDPAALFASQLRQAVSMPCPTESTPEPPMVRDILARRRDEAVPPERVHDYAEACRKARG